MYNTETMNSSFNYDPLEEERKRKALLEAEAETESTPVKQTIVTDPTTGKQTMKIEGSVQDLSANNPLTPTVTGPIAPYEPPTVGPSQVVAGPPQATPTLTPTADQSQAEVQRLMQQNQIAQGTPIGEVPQTRQMPTGATAGPVSPYSIAPQPTGGLGLQAGQPTQTATPKEPQSMAMQTPGTEVHPFMTKLNEFTQIANDPKQLMSFAGRQDVPEWLKTRAQNNAADLIIANREKQQAQEKLATMSETDLAKVLREKTTGGNWLKAAMFGILGMDQSAQAEAAKLGIGKETVVQGSDGTPYMIKMSSNGTPLEGHNATTGEKLSTKELVSVAANASQKLDLVGGTYVSDALKDKNGLPLVGTVVRDKNTGTSWVQTDEGRKPMAGFRPQSSMGSLNDMRARTIQEINLKLQGKSGEEAMQILRPYNQLLVQQGYTPVQPSEVGITAPQISGGATQAPPAAAPAAAMTPAPAKPPVKATAPISPEQLAKQQAEEKARQAIESVGGTNVSNLTPPKSPYSGLNPNLTYTPTAGQGLGGRPTGPQLEAEKTKQKEAAQEEGTDLGKIKVNQPKAEDKADYLVTKIDALVSHPGFETSVGLKGPSLGFGLWNPPPGTDAANWAQRFKEVKGGAFTQAIEVMRGLGALSDREGAAASAAIERMDQSQTETEFKEAAKDFQDVIKRNIDRNREKLGQPLKYGTPPASESGKSNENTTASGNKFKRVP